MLRHRHREGRRPVARRALLLRRSVAGAIAVDPDGLMKTAILALTLALRPGRASAVVSETVARFAKLRARISTEKPPGSKPPDKIVVQQPGKPAQPDRQR
jgi:hypothetical protein